MVEIAGNYLQAVLPHAVPRQVHPRDALDPQQRLDLLSALLPDPVPTQSHHLQAPHFHHAAHQFAQSVFGEALS